MSKMYFSAPCPTCIMYAKGKRHDLLSPHRYWRKEMGTTQKMRHTTRLGRAYHRMAKKAGEPT